MEITAFVVCLVLAWIPAAIVSRVSSRGLFFGVHVGHDPNPEALRAVIGGWLRNVLLVVLVTAVAGLTRFGVLSPFLATLVAQGVLILGFVAVYHLAYFQAAILALPPNTPEDIVAAAHGRRRDLFPAVAMLAVTGGACVAVVYAAGAFPALPDRIPVHFDGAGKPDAWTSKSWGNLLLIPMVSLAVGGMLTLMAWLAVRTGFGGRSRHRRGFSPQLKEELSTSTAVFLSAMAILVTVMLAVMSIGSARVALGRAEGLGQGALVLTLVVLVFGLAGAVFFTRRRWRAGADSHYKAGLFYVNREDPALFVPKRIGVGWTLNFGNPVAFIVLIAMIVLPLVAALLIARSSR